MKSDIAYKPAWHIVQVRAGNERSAGEALIVMGFTVYVPSYRREYQHHRTKRWLFKNHPLMPGYLFVLASPHWTRIPGCDQVLAVLSSPGSADSSPVRVADADVVKFREAQDAGMFDKLRVHDGNVHVGDTVKIAEGAFSGISAVVARTGDEHLTMMLNILGREVKARAPLDILQRTG